MTQNNPTGAPDSFERPLRPAPAYSPTPSDPAVPAGGAAASFPPPGADARPYAPASGGYPYAPASGGYPFAAPTEFAGGATAVGASQHRRPHLVGRVAFGLGSLAAIAILLGGTGLLGGTTTQSGVVVPAGQTTTQSGTTQSGTSGTSGTSDGSSGSGTSGGTSGAGTSGGTSQAGSGQVGSGQTGSQARTRSSGQLAATQAQTTGVVLIKTAMTGGTAEGTGMILDSTGDILTNYHVVQGSTTVEVTVLATDTTYTAKVVGHDATNDVALLKVDATGLDPVTIDTDPVSVGDTVTAVGNANGQEFLTGATGTITNTSATVTVSNDSASGSETLKGVYETNASAQPGDSGGPLFDAETEVTGMTTAGEQTYAGPGSRQGAQSGQATTVVSYAIPIAKALSIVKQIESGTETATVKIGPNPYLGIMVSSRASGSLVVSSVTSGTPAAKAGITAGSTITAVGGTAVASQAEIAAVLAGHNPGDVLSVAWVDASGASHTAKVTLGSSPLN